MPHDPREDNPPGVGTHPETPDSDVAPTKTDAARVYPKVSIRRFRPDSVLEMQIQEVLGPSE